MKEITGKYKGLQVAKAKEEIKNDMLKERTAELMYELTAKVICRCLTPSTIKIVSDQWFIAYGNKEWKKLAHKALDKLKLYPGTPRQQLAYTIDWLRDWACTREKGLGTKLPWDEKWLIESLSDSTIYFAFYPIAHLLQKINPRLIDDKIFDYVFLGKGKKPNVQDIGKMREEFEYWYPFDFNTSGKDLIQNHIAFSLFNHAAIFPKEKWPAGLRINGWVTINEQKMSKSLGNIILLRDIAKDYSPDAARLAIAFGGEGLDDPNWDSEFARSVKEKLMLFYDHCIQNYNKGAEKYGYPEKLMESQLNTIMKTTTEFMENAMFRSAIQTGCFEMQRKLRQYLKLTKNNPNKELMNKIIESQLLMLAPFTPFICEELWSNIGKNGFVSVAHWPKYDESKIDKKAESISAFIDSTRIDILEVLKLAKIEKPFKIKLFVAEKWKYKFIEKLKSLMQKTRNTNELMKELMSSELKQHGNEITKLIPKLLGDKSKIPEFVLEQETEIQALKDASENYEEEFKCKIEVVAAEGSKEPKSKQAMPGKVAILVE
jgi:leucyl-tRNA synthetase